MPQTLLLPLLALLQPLLAQPLSHKQDCVALGRPRYDAICSARGVQHYTPVISDDFVVACIMIMFLLLFAVRRRRRRPPPRARQARRAARSRAAATARRRPPPRCARGCGHRCAARRLPALRARAARAPAYRHQLHLTRARLPRVRSRQAVSWDLLSTRRPRHASWRPYDGQLRNFVGYSNICTLSTTARA